ncbi:unnamed protein product [Cyprideis torosa]|uniref:Uncharacterized protein n=1 Tax=Cyprideis torosa TaxID=163714 RepID=A0A7R8W6N2_9CRUS|nr:unnamed protein product [Cyprideis torosa]CAG0885413.1 unnamed protein product [Cyprideis torosa]
MKLTDADIQNTHVNKNDKSLTKDQRSPIGRYDPGENFVPMMTSVAGTHELCMDYRDSEAFLIMKKFQQLQTERAEAYNLFNEAHKLYLQSFPSYEYGPQFKKTITHVTTEFKRISEEAGEEQKLRWTVQLQRKLQERQQFPSNRDKFDDEIRAARKELAKITETINDHLEEIKEEVEEFWPDNRLNKQKD